MSLDAAGYAQLALRQVLLRRLGALENQAAPVSRPVLQFRREIYARAQRDPLLLRHRPDSDDRPLEVHQLHLGGGSQSSGCAAGKRERGGDRAREKKAFHQMPCILRTTTVTQQPIDPPEKPLIPTPMTARSVLTHSVISRGRDRRRCAVPNMLPRMSYCDWSRSRSSHWHPLSKPARD